jgi:hypothetical protein
MAWLREAVAIERVRRLAFCCGNPTGQLPLRTNCDSVRGLKRGQEMRNL